MRRGILLSSFLLLLLIFLSVIILIEGSGEVRVYKYNYDRRKAVQYALENANEGKDYQNLFSEDCTNFVSFSLQAGGWPMKEPPFWYYLLPHIWPFSWLRNHYWFFHSKDDHSRSWTVVTDFSEFIQISGRGAKIFLGNEPNEVKNKIKELLKEKKVKEGDIIQRIGGGCPGHTMIITEIKEEMLKISYHSPNTKNQELEEFLKKYLEKCPRAEYYLYLLEDYFNE